MPTLYLVRHGQASFGSDDYDRLSPLGQRQCRRLGQWWAARGQGFAGGVLAGTLRRHAESAAAIAEGLGQPLQPLTDPAFDEYDSAAVLAALPPEPGGLPDAHTPEGYRAHFRRLRDGLAGWMAGRLQPAGMPAYADYAAGLRQALARTLAAQGDVLLVSSGGVIANAVAQLLGAPPETAVELNFRLRNSALTEFVITPRRHQLLAYNHLPHLEALPEPERAGWVTYM